MSETRGVLTAKQQRFVAEFLVDLNATQAAIRAGYKAAIADVTGPRLLGVGDDVGKALTADEEKKLVDACSESRSRSLLVAVLMALNTGMRLSELRLLRWVQADLKRRTVRVGRSKTQAGANRTVPLNARATTVLQFWADQFPDRKPEHYIFPSERYGAGGNTFRPCVYDHDPKHPIKSWKEDGSQLRRLLALKFVFTTCVTR